MLMKLASGIITFIVIVNHYEHILLLQYKVPTPVTCIVGFPLLNNMSFQASDLIDWSSA